MSPLDDENTFLHHQRPLKFLATDSKYMVCVRRTMTFLQRSSILYRCIILLFKLMLIQNYSFEDMV